jgi:hypothetical protein
LANPHKSLSPHFTRLAKSAIHSAFLVTVFFSFRTDVRAQARASIGSITLPTYDEGPPDPNPPFDVYASENFNYPYTMRTNLTGTKSDHTWRAIILENEYLKCTILPDLGGHIYTCLDKISGQPMFYQNPSIKKAVQLPCFAQLGVPVSGRLRILDQCRRQRLGYSRQYRSALWDAVDRRAPP